jgi:uncharacterized repeat protein (TIGR02543 family)
MQQMFCFGGNMRIPAKIVHVLILFAAVFTVIACNKMNSPTDDYTETPSTYTVIFDSQFSNNGYAITMANPTTKTVTPPATTIDALPTEPTMSGYIFGGWYTGANATGTKFTETTTVNKDNTSYDGSKTVYAYWYKYLVTFYSDGTAVSYKGITPPSKTINSLPAAPTKTGYTFAGWWTAESGGGTQFFATTPVDGNLNIYAKWSNASYVYKVTYNDNWGAAIGEQYVISDATTVGTLPKPDPTHLFYNFVNWNTKSDGSGTEFKGNTEVTTDTPVYAQWSDKIEYHTITYNSGWGTSVEAQYVTGTDLVEFTDFTLENNGISLPASQKQCYDFGGWWTEKNGGGTVFDASTSVTADITVYAQWTYVGFTPSYPAPSTYTIGGPGPSCVGKVFYIEGGGTSGSHGLEAAPPGWYDPEKYADYADPSLAWIYGDPVTDEEGNVTQQTQTTLNGNTSTGIGTYQAPVGLANSDAIITQSGSTASSNSAARLCKNYRGGGLNNWFLPSKDELAQLYAQRDATRWGGFDATFYWSSSEYDTWNAWSQAFFNGTQNGTLKSYERRIRPVRAF